MVDKREETTAMDEGRLVEVEDLIGGRVLAWIGGAALLLGVAFFLAIAVSRGWLGEGARCGLAAAGALGLLALAARLRERGGRQEAVVAAAGAAIGALDVDLAVASRAYGLLPALPATLVALAVGAVATVLAVRWRSPVVGALGILGGLTAPVLAGAPSNGGTIALLLAAAAAAAGVLVWQRWDWLAIGGFAVTALQVGAWLAHVPAPGAVLAALAVLGVLVTVQAVGLELRTAAPKVRPVGAFLLAADAVLLAAAGTWALQRGHHGGLADLWLGVLAAAHIGVGLCSGRSARVSAELRLLALGLGVVLADIAVAATFDGVALPIAYAAGALGFAAVSRLLPRRAVDELAAHAGLGAHILLAAAHVLVVEAPPAGAGSGASSAAVALIALAAASFAGARVPSLRRPYRGALDAVALAAPAYLAALLLPPAALAIAWAAEATALALVWRRTGDGVAAGGAWAHLLGAAIVALAVVVPLPDLGAAPHDALGAAGVLGALALACVRMGRCGLGADAIGARDVRLTLDAVALALLAYLEALLLGPVALAVTWAATAALLATVFHRTGDRAAEGGALAHVAGAAVLAVAALAPPTLLVDGLDDVLGACLGLGATAAAAALAARAGAGRATGVRVLWSAAALGALLLASGLVVTVGGGAGPQGLQTGQMWLSALWAAAGAGTLVAALLARRAALRRGALALLGVTTVKVFVIDLASLDSAYRAVSFVALGLLLLGAAFAWQKLRPVLTTA
jgi:uncharacterized membrane protein